MSILDNSQKLITIGELKQHLSSFEDSDELDFSGLEFYRTKKRGPGLVQIEFSESILRDDKGQVIIKNHD